jgi:hypothetical protein
MPDFSAPVPVIETPQPLPPAPEKIFSAFVPLALILGILIFASARDIINLHRHLMLSQVQNSKSAEHLKKAGQESDLVTKIQDEIVKLAPTDPSAARLQAEFFPPPATIKSTPPPDSSPPDKTP